MRSIILTNNPMVKEACAHVDFIDGTMMDVINRARDLVHLGHRLISHPLSSSIKPNQTPYKTVVLTKTPEECDMDSLAIIEHAIERLTVLGIAPEMNEKIKQDFQLIDYEIIKDVLKTP